MRVIVVTCCFVLLLADGLHAHQDSPVAVSPGGIATGVPATFMPLRVFVDLEPLDQRTFEEPRLSVETRRGAFEMPACLTALMDYSAPRWVEVGASWYHDVDVLPYYLSINFKYGDSIMQDGGLHLLLDLVSGKLLDDYVWTPVPCGDDAAGATCSRRVRFDRLEVCTLEALRASDVPPKFYMCLERRSEHWWE